MGSLYFDNAATSYPKPRSVYGAVAEAMLRCSGNPGRSTHKEAQASARAVLEAREEICGLFNTSDPSKVIFSLNATSVLNTAILGLRVNCGNFLISDVEHNAVLRPVAEKCARIGGGFRVFKTYPDDEKAALESFIGAIDVNTVCVAVNAASNVDGRVLPIKEIGDICFKESIPFIIDASQLAGHRKIDLSAIHFSMFCCAGHKGLFSPMGCGFGIIGDIYCDIEPLVFGGNGLRSKDIFIGEDLPERFESGTVAVPAIAGLLSGINYLKIRGDEIIERENRITERIVKELSTVEGIELFHAKGGVPVISIRHRSVKCEEIASFLSERGIAVRSGFHCAPLAHHSIGTYESGTVRISPSAFNGINDCVYLADSIRKLVL